MRTKTVRVSITMPIETHAQIMEAAEKRKCSASDIYREGAESLGFTVPKVKVGNPYLGRPVEG